MAGDHFIEMSHDEAFTYVHMYGRRFRVHSIDTRVKDDGYMWADMRRWVDRPHRYEVMLELVDDPLPPPPPPRKRMTQKDLRLRRPE